MRRIPELNQKATEGQLALFETHRFPAFFTTSDLDTVTADQAHRQHAIIEQINADFNDSELVHLPTNWPREPGRTAAFAAACGPPQTAASSPPATRRTKTWNTTAARSATSPRPPPQAGL